MAEAKYGSTNMTAHSPRERSDLSFKHTVMTVPVRNINTGQIREEDRIYVEEWPLTDNQVDELLATGLNFEL